MGLSLLREEREPGRGQVAHNGGGVLWRDVVPLRRADPKWVYHLCKVNGVAEAA